MALSVSYWISDPAREGFSDSAIVKAELNWDVESTTQLERGKGESYILIEIYRFNGLSGSTATKQMSPKSEAEANIHFRQIIGITDGTETWRRQVILLWNTFNTVYSLKIQDNPLAIAS
jgi:hypothetical protein